jgi:hypothetical protein
MAEDQGDDWHNAVDERLVNLNSAQGTTDIELAQVEKKLSEIDDILRGDPQNKLDGLIPDINYLKNEVNKFNRIFDKDYLGHGGLQSFITYLYDQEQVRDRQAGYRWGFVNSVTATFGTIIVSIVGLIGYLIINWGAVSMFWNRLNKEGPLEQKIEAAKHPKPKHRHYVIRERSDASASDDPVPQ